jgi:hypothetical protein
MACPVGFSFNAGWLPQPPDERDYLYGVGSGPGSVQTASPLLPVADTVILRKQLPTTPQHQGNHASCIAHAVLTLAHATLFTAGCSQPVLSRAWLYWYTRVLSGLDPTVDGGGYPRAGFKALTKYGAPLESAWDYGRVCQRPDSTLSTAAESHQAMQYQFLPGTVAGIKCALANGYPVSIGIRLTASIMDTPESGVIAPFTGSSLGGHYCVIAGYFDREYADPAGVDTVPAGGHFLLLNSWGTAWAHCGWAYLPYTVLESANPADCAIITAMENGLDQ